MACSTMLAGSCFAGPLVIAHRGASYYNPKTTSGTLYAPENTISSNKLAWEMGADAVECDVYLTADNRVMAMHDENTSRTTDGKIAVDLAKTNSSELRKIDVGSWYSAQYVNEKIPFLEELIELVPPGKKLYVEIKCGPEVLKYVDEIFTKSGKRNQMVVIGFGLNTMIECAKLMPDVPVYYLKGCKQDPTTKACLPYEVSMLKTIQDNKLTGVDLYYEGLDKNFCDAALAAKVGLVAWTVDKPADMEKLADLGVEGITTNRPDLMIETMAKRNKK